MVNQALNDGPGNFDDLFPCLREVCSGEHASNWVSVSRFFHNLAGEDDGRPYCHRFFDKFSEALT
jgi:hypothetical protein